MSRFYKRYGPFHQQFIYVGRARIKNTEVTTRLANGQVVSYGGNEHEHDLYYAITRDYEEWDMPGNLSWAEFLDTQGLTVNIAKEHKLPLDGKQKFKMEFSLEEMKKYIGSV